MKHKLSSPWKLFKSALRDFRSGLKPYLKIVGIVVLPINLVALVPGLSSTDASGNTTDITSSFAPFVAIIMNVALIWAITHRAANSKKVSTVAQAYYDGSSAIVRYLLVSCILVIMLIPATLGTLFYGVGVMGATAVGVSLAEQIILGSVAVLLALPSAYLIIRYGLSPYVLVGEDLRPMAALRRSRALTAGRFWPVTGRMVMLVLFTILLSIPAILVTIGLSTLRFQPLAVVFFQIASTMVTLPFVNLYLVNLYRELKQTAPAPTTQESTAPALEEAPA